MSYFCAVFLKWPPARLWMQLRWLLLALCAISASPAFSNSLQIVVPFPAASPSGELARMLSTRLAAKLGHPVQVEYRPGGNSRVAQDVVRSAKADGSVILWASSAIVVEPVIAQKPQEMARDLQALALAARASLVMVSRPGLEARSFGEVLSLIRSGKPLSCAYGGGAMLLACSALKQLGHGNVVLIPYASSGQALPDVAGDRVDIAFTLLEPSVKALASAGKIVALGRTQSVSSDPLAAALPRLDHLLPQLAISPWLGWFAPAGTPVQATQRFLQAAQEVMQEPEMQKRMEDFDFRAEFIPEPEFSRLLSSEYARFTQLLSSPTPLSAPAAGKALLK